VGISTREISDVIKERLKDFDATLVSADVGRIVAVGDGIAQIYGLQNAMAGELLEFPEETFGLALNLEEDQVRSVILGEFGHLREGDEVKTTGRLLEVPVGDELLGRIVNPLGRPRPCRSSASPRESSPASASTARFRLASRRSTR
jgi:F-type H+-transporting ATPase subunit alpha